MSGLIEALLLLPSLEPLELVGLREVANKILASREGEASSVKLAVDLHALSSDELRAFVLHTDALVEVESLIGQVPEPSTLEPRRPRPLSMTRCSFGELLDIADDGDCPF